MLLLDLSSIDPISALSIIGGILLFVLFKIFEQKIPPKQIKVIAFILVGLSAVTTVLSIVIDGLGSLMVATFVLLIVAFLIFRKQLQNRTLSKGPVYVPTKEDEEKQEEINSKYDEDMVRGKYHLSQKEYNKARDFFIHALKLRENSVEPWYQIGLINMELKRFEHAILAFKRVLDDFPSDPKTQQKLAEAKEQLEISRQNKKNKKNKKDRKK